MDAGIYTGKSWLSDEQDKQVKKSVPNEICFGLFGSLVIFAGLFMSPAAHAICNDCKVPPIVGDYSYWYSRCSSDQGPYGNEFDAEFSGMWKYYGTCNDPLVISQSSWPTQSNTVGGDCGGPARYPRLKLGVEDKSHRGSTIQYCSTLADGLGIWRTRPVECPSGTVQVYESCRTDYSKENRNKNYGTCTKEGQDVADPINVSIGNSYQRETDLPATPLTGLTFFIYQTLPANCQDHVASFQQILFIHFVQRDRDTRSRGISVLVNICIEFFKGNFHSLCRCFNNPHIRLVGYDIGDIIDIFIVINQEFFHGFAQYLYRKPIDLLPVHTKVRVIYLLAFIRSSDTGACKYKMVGAGPIATENAVPDVAHRGIFVACKHSRTGAVPKEDTGIPILPVSNPG